MLSKALTGYTQKELSDDEAAAIHLRRTDYTVRVAGRPLPLVLADLVLAFLYEHHREPRYILLGHREYMAALRANTNVVLGIHPSGQPLIFQNIPILELHQPSFCEVV